MMKANLSGLRPLNENLLLLSENELTFEELFEHYIKTGFMYDQKIERIKPHLKLIRRNWENGWKGGGAVFRTAVYKDLINNRKGTLTVWRNTGNSWVFQHLTSETSKAVLALMADVLNKGIQADFQAGQNWFSPTNRFCRRLYNNEVIIGDGNSQKSLFHYYRIDPAFLGSVSKNFSISEVKGSSGSIELVRFIERHRSSLYCKSEDIYSHDLNLESLDIEYRKYNLGRKRYYWIARSKDDRKVVAVLVANRGPFGFNFSFLENRCEIIVEQSVGKEEKELLCSMLLRKASFVYFNKDKHIEYPDRFLYLLVDESLCESVEKSGGVKIREYMSGIWLRQDFYRWRDYLMNFFNKRRGRV